MKHLRFWFDVVSPYAYLAFEQLPQTLDGLSVAVEYRPVPSAEMLERSGGEGPVRIDPKRTWTCRHVSWLAHASGIQLRLPQRHPFDPLPLLRLAWACASADATPNRRVCEAVLRHAWLQGGDPAESPRLDELRRALAPALDPDGDEVKRRLSEATDEAMARGIFGVPSIEADGRLFYGFEALPMLAAALRGDPWFSGADWDAAGKVAESRSGI